MENASKALLMAAGILIGVLILTLIVTLFVSSKQLSDEYETTKQSEKIQQFNVNFTKYIGQELTIHQVVNICNYAIEKGFKKENISGFKTKKDIQDEVKLYSNNEESIPKYKITVEEYSDEGYINAISFDESK